MSVFVCVRVYVCRGIEIPSRSAGLMLKAFLAYNRSHISGSLSVSQDHPRSLSLLRSRACSFALALALALTLLSRSCFRSRSHVFSYTLRECGQTAHAETIKQKEAAEGLSSSTIALKRACRKLGIKRCVWECVPVCVLACVHNSICEEIRSKLGVSRCLCACVRACACACACVRACMCVCMCVCV